MDDELKELKVSISDKEVDGAVDEVKKSYNLTDEQLQRPSRARATPSPSTASMMRKQIGRYKLISEKVRKNVKVSDADVQSEYDRMTRSEGEDYEVHVRHILVAVPRNATSAQVEQARRRRRRWRRRRAGPGVNFAELAKKKQRGQSARRTAATWASSSAARWSRSSSGWRSTSRPARSPSRCGPSSAGTS